VLPGRILTELIANDRIIGGINAASAEQAKEVYARFVEGHIFLTDTSTAEMVKVIENTFRDVNIALANETALLCEQLGIDFWEVARLANRHPRVNLHSAGPGVGGHCISVDPWFLVEQFPETALLIRLARTRNDFMPHHVAASIMKLTGGADKPVIAQMGLAYKSNVDDIRESPALRVYSLLREAGCEVRVHDPHVHQAPMPLVSLEEAVQGADCLVIVTAHQAFKALDPATIKQAMRSPVVFDAHNLLEHEKWREQGFCVHVIGKGAA
jgi:UDP-N-acetyl-D-mannosaminuronic acid dehydrogenase